MIFALTMGWFMVFMTLLVLIIAAPRNTKQGTSKNLNPLTAEVTLKHKYVAVIKWNSSRPFASCEINYGPSNSRSGQILRIPSPSAQGYTIDNLEPNRTYVAIIVCFDKNSTRYTKKLSFTTRHINSPTHTPQVISHDRITIPSSEDTAPSLLTKSLPKTDIALGIVFGLLGALLFTAAGIYVWKHYKRRQAIRRMWSRSHQSEHNPFQALQQHEEE